MGFKGFELTSVRCKRVGHQESLRFQIALGDSFFQFFKHDALVQCVLIDDQDALFVLGDEETLLYLHHSIGTKNCWQ